MSVDWRRRDGGVSLVIELSGALDSKGAAALTGPIQGDPASPGIVVVDLRRVSFIDSAGLGGLAGLHRCLTDVGAALRLVVDDGTMAWQVLAVTHLDELIPVYNSLDEARHAAG